MLLVKQLSGARAVPDGLYIRTVCKLYIIYSIELPNLCYISELLISVFLFCV
jgi:hypothetical protein